MEERNFLHLQGKKCGDLVAPSAFQRKLLPYEWGLIQALEITEQEYREIFQRLAEEQRKRSADYAHIPDVVNEPVSTTAILVNLAIGLVLTGVSMLLAPKPQTQQRDDREQQSIIGSNQEGRTRFANTIGFDGTPQLAQLGSRIPLIFGDYREASGDIEASGGIVAEPLLVWSQVLSKGTFQNFKGQYVICERGLDFFPDKQSYLMGGQPIDDIYEVNYELFFKSQINNNILTAADSQYGLAAPGDDQIFTVWNAGEKTKGFCSAYSPTNKSVFGVSAPIRNGGRWSLNWRVINLFQNEYGRDDAGLRLQNQRRKIAGSGGDSRDEGMQGSGRWYSPQMGLEALSRGNDSNWQFPPSDNTWEPDVNLGDYVRFRITPRNYVFPDDLNAAVSYGGDNPVDEKGVNYDDINSALNSLRAAADDAMQRGEIFCCNQTLLQVTDRSGSFEPARENTDRSDGRVYVTLKVIGFTGQDHTIGIASQNVFRHYGVMRETGGDGIDGRREANWYSLVKFDMAQAVNTRACQVTEIGIKSQVWTRINGLCNFSDVPVPKNLREYDEDNISVSNGNINKYTFRTSFFKLAVRSVDDDRYDSDYVDGFSILDDVLFAVRGETPTDQFNFIRIIPTGPEAKKFEYRIIPITATQVYRNLDHTRRAFVLGVLNPLQTQTLTVPNSSDRFSVQFHAAEERLGVGVYGFDRILDLEELHQAPGGLPGGQEQRKVVEYDDPDPDTFRTANFDGNSRDQFAFDQAALETIFGSLQEQGDRRIEELDYGTEARDRRDWKIGDKRIPMSLRAVVAKNRDDNAEDRYGTKRIWKLTQADFDNPDDKKKIGDQGAKIEIENFDIDSDSWYWRNHLSDSNDRGQSRECDLRLKATRSYRTETYTLTAAEAGFREWDNYAQVKEISPYDEVTRSSDRGPEHEIMYVNESDGVQTEFLDDFTYNNMSMLGVKFKSMNQTQQLQSMQIWLKQGISVKKLTGTDGASDLLPDIVYFLLTEQGRGMRNQIPEEMIDRSSFETTNRFLEANRLFYNGAITDLVNVRSYINQVAPFFLCHLSIRAGKFFMTPAIPTDSSGVTLTTAVPVTGYFNDGNIVAGSFKLNYLDASERKDFRCVVKYRDAIKNSMPQYKTIQMKYKDLTIIPDQQEFDLTAFCTTAHHAKMAARYLLSSRRRIDHTVEFSTSPFGIALAPGDYIKVDTVASPLETRVSGRINDQLQVIGGIDDGTYTATIYRQAADSVVTEEIVIAGGQVTDETLRNSLFAIPLTQRRLGIYMIEELTLDEEGMVQVKASHHPVNDQGVSKIVLDLTLDGDNDRFESIL